MSYQQHSFLLLLGHWLNSVLTHRLLNSCQITYRSIVWTHFKKVTLIIQKSSIYIYLKKQTAYLNFCGIKNIFLAWGFASLILVHAVSLSGSPCVKLPCNVQKILFPWSLLCFWSFCPIIWNQPWTLEEGTML